MVFDGRSFAYTLSGTQVQTIGLLGGLVRAGVEITVALTAELHATVRTELGELVDAMRFVEHSRVGRVELFHKPHQFWSLHDLAESLAMADRVVLTQLDMILERTPAFRRSREKWEEQRATTAAALASVDQTASVDRGGARRGQRRRARARPRDPRLLRRRPSHGRHVPDPARPLGGRPYLLAVGNAYWHKNRTFALRLLGWLVERHGWDGGLVLAGGHPDGGSSLEAETRLLHETPALAGRVEDLGHVSDEERLWRSSAGAELTLFPSYYEGFGFVPFESAALGTACVYTYGSSMKELLPQVGGPPVVRPRGGRSVRCGAPRERCARRREVVEAIDAASARDLTWDLSRPATSTCTSARSHGSRGG